MIKLLANLAASGRSGTYQGRQFHIRPVTLIVPGVLAGSQGPLFYPPEELAKNTGDWNGIPITLGHPAESARSPEVINLSGVGYLFNTKVNDDGSLVGEAWVDIARAQLLNANFLGAFQGGQPIEVSTGLGVTVTKTKEHLLDNKGRVYDTIATEYRPDHLAILMDSVGACSLEDGCGIRNTKPNTGDTGMDRTKTIDYIIKNDCCLKEEDRETLNQLSDQALQRMEESLKKAKQTEAVANAAKKGYTDPGGNDHVWNEEKQVWESKMKKEEKPVENKDEGEKTKKPEPLTEDQWMAQAPEKVRNALARAEAIEKKHRDQAIEVIKKVEGNKLTDNQLAEMPTETLESLAATMAAQSKEEKKEGTTYNWEGAAGGSDTVNQSELVPMEFPGEEPAPVKTE